MKDLENAKEKDILIVRPHWGEPYLVEVTKTTKTMVIGLNVNGAEFRFNKDGVLLPRQSMTNTYAYIATKEDLDKYKKERRLRIMRAKIRKIEWDKISDADVETVYEIIKKYSD